MFQKYLGLFLNVLARNFLKQKFAQYENAIELALDVLAEVSVAGEQTEVRASAAKNLHEQLVASGVTLLDQDACKLVVNAVIEGLEAAGSVNFFQGLSRSVERIVEQRLGEFFAKLANKYAYKDIRKSLPKDSLTESIEMHERLQGRSSTPDFKINLKEKDYYDKNWIEIGIDKDGDSRLKLMSENILKEERLS